MKNASNNLKTAKGKAKDRDAKASSADSVSFGSEDKTSSDELLKDDESSQHRQCGASASSAGLAWCREATQHRQAVDEWLWRRSMAR